MRGLASVPRLTRTRAEFAAARQETAGGELAAVFTMGALHEGHATLIRAARAAVGPAGGVILTVFVNPLQFGAGEDLDRYPRTLDADLALAASEGVDVVFAPTASEMYPQGAPSVRVEPGAQGVELEGAVRPGHFSGVLTVVAKLIGITRPAATFFGEKDYQQLVLVRRMVRDLDLDVRVVGVPTVREPDGLALSSRNRYLDPAHRAGAVVLSRALRAGAAAAGDGPDAVLATARDVLSAPAARDEAPASIDYLELRSVELNSAPLHGEARLLVAAKFGSTRLIDNIRVDLASGMTGAPATAPLTSTA